MASPCPDNRGPSPVPGGGCTSSRVLGPVPSRRLGRSLGVNSVPFKTCTYACVYCQLGPTTTLTTSRSVFYETHDILDEIHAALMVPGAKVDYVTLLGSGEPTLAANMGEMLEGISESWSGKTALLTNGSLLWDNDVHKESLAFDCVMPTVSAGTEKLFRRIHGPHRKLSCTKVLDGIERFSEEYTGTLCIEVMLLKGVNDDETSLNGIGAAIGPLDPDEIHIVAPVRPPCEKWVEVPERDRVELALESIPGSIDMTEPEVGEFEALLRSATEGLESIVRVHPLRERQALEILTGRGLSSDEALDALRALVRGSRVMRLEHRGDVFYRAKE